MTTASRPAPYRIPVSFEGKHGLILLDQIRTLDKKRLVKRLGAIGDKTLSDTLRTLQEVFAE
jgi:mRNA interferase MazF